jgi:demethylphylloquinol methyltransferase
VDHSQRSRVQTLFNTIAPVYDQLNAGLSLGQHTVWKYMAIQWTTLNPEGLNVDLCCGSGDIALYMARFLRGRGQIVGVDFSPNQLAIAQQRAQASMWTQQIEWIEADVLALPFAENTVDTVTMGYGLRNVTDISRCLAEILRVLKPTGTAAILDFNRPESVWVQQFQRWYLQNIVVPIAAQFNLKAEYEYLETSVARFPTGAEQVGLAQDCGFGAAHHYDIAGGTMGILVLTKSLR